MSDASARAYVFALELFGIKLGLEQIRALLASLDHPERAYPSVVIAGTNGKGSVVAMVERGLRAAGYGTGRYTSPHLIAIEERIAINGAPISADEFDRAAERLRDVASTFANPPTFFEATTAMALDVFREARVDVAVLEVGLGGRLDATNAVTPVATAITAIDLDHQQHLGDTIEAIATEKAGIIKPGVPVILGSNPPHMRGVIENTARSLGAPMVFAPDHVEVDVRVERGRARFARIRTARRSLEDVTLALAGRHQIDNAVTAITLLDALDATGGRHVSDDAVRTALGDVVWPARLEVRQWRGHDVLIDGAHNPAGARALAAFVAEHYGRRLPFVVGIMRDKHAEDILAALAGAANAWICTAAATTRAIEPDALAALAQRVNPAVPTVTATSPADALAHACALGAPIVVAGSLYLAGEVRALTP